MSHPVLVLRPPERRGRQIALSADLLLGNDDQVTISALVGPETQAWVRQYGKRALSGLGVKLDRAKRLLGQYVRVEGDWGGDLAALSFDVLRRAAASGVLRAPSEPIVEVASLYRALDGRSGPEAQAQAHGWVDALEEHEAQGNVQASHYRRLFDVAHSMQSGDAPGTDEDLEMCRALDSIAGPCCSSCAEGKSCDGTAPVKVTYDIEEAIMLPEHAPIRIAGLGQSALGYRAFRKIAPQVSWQEAARRFYEPARPSLPPGIHDSVGAHADEADSFDRSNRPIRTHPPAHAGGFHFPTGGSPTIRSAGDAHATAGPMVSHPSRRSRAPHPSSDEHPYS